MRVLPRGLGLFLLLATACVWSGYAVAAGKPKAAAPRDPVGAIVEASRKASVIAFGEYHGNRATHTFLQALVRDPRFAAAGIDLVVEFGNALYQPTLDRYIAGEDVAEGDIQKVWNYTTIGKGEWGRGNLYPGLFHAARAANAVLPVSQRFRVLGGDPPVDWEREDLGGFVRSSPTSAKVEWPTPDERYDREFHAIDVIRREVLARRRRAFVIYGGAHMMRGQGMVRKLEQRFRIRTFVITAPIAHDLEAVQPSVRTWPVPSLALVRDTAFADLDSALFLKPKRQENTAGAYYDAVLYLGPAASLVNAVSDQRPSR